MGTIAFNFRQTQAHVVDVAPEVFVAQTSVRPVTLGGVPCGWVSQPSTADWTGPNDRRAGGWHGIANTGQRDFYLAPPEGPGDYDLDGLFGDPFACYREVVELVTIDGQGVVTVLYTLLNTPALGGIRRVYDASGNYFGGTSSAEVVAAWAAGRVPKRVTLPAEFFLRVGGNGVGSTTGNTHVSHLSLTKVVPPDDDAPVPGEAVLQSDRVTVDIPFTDASLPIVLAQGNTGFMERRRVNGSIVSTTGTSAAAVVDNNILRLTLATPLPNDGTTLEWASSAVQNLRDSATSPNYLAPTAYMPVTLTTAGARLLRLLPLLLR